MIINLNEFGTGGGGVDPQEVQEIVADYTYSKAEVDENLEAKQDTLVSGTNIKTINGEAILGEGDITIESGGDVYGVYMNANYNTNKFALGVQKNGEYITNANISVQIFNNNGSASASITKSGIWYIFDYYSNYLAAQINISVGGEEIYGTVVPLHSNLQQKLQSGYNIKTINGQSILGSGNIEIQGGGGDETDPIWTAEKVNYYTKDETDGLVGDVKSTAETAYSIAQDASSVASTAESKADDALTKLEGKADKDEIPSLDGYATEQWVGEQGYLTEHQQLKTINGETIVGEGDLTIEAGGKTVLFDVQYRENGSELRIYPYYTDGEIVNVSEWKYNPTITLYDSNFNSLGSVTLYKFTGLNYFYCSDSKIQKAVYFEFYRHSYDTTSPKVSLRSHPLSYYYTKGEIDSKLGDLEIILKSI